MLWKYSYFGKSAAGSCADRALSGFAACESNGLTSFRVRDSHPIPLFSWNKNACPFGTAGAVCTASASVRVAHLPQKPVIDSFFIFVFAFPAKRQKRLPFLRQSASITYILFLYMAVSTCLTSISRKVPPSELPAAVTGISFLPAYLFASMYASAPEKFLHPSDNSSPDLSRPCGHYSCLPAGGISPHFR